MDPWKDHWKELVAIGVDALIFSLCRKIYHNYTNTIALIKEKEPGLAKLNNRALLVVQQSSSVYTRLMSVLQNAPTVGSTADINSLTEEAKKYVIFRGEVAPLGKPITSMTAPFVTGVIQRIILREHRTARNACGFWSSQNNLINETYNVVPFALKHGKMVVEVLHPLEAFILDLDTVSNKFETTSSGFMDYLLGFFSGITPKGIETTEEMLKEGSIITAIGELGQDGLGNAQISPPTVGYFYFLTSMSVSSLVRRLEDRKFVLKCLMLLTGAVSITLSVYTCRQMWVAFENQRDEEVKKSWDDLVRKLRRNASNSQTSVPIPEERLCVACRVNAKEMILLPCGHVCLCQDCCDVISSNCPMCRLPIQRKIRAYI